MKGFNKIWHLLPSSPKVCRRGAFGDPLLLKKENDRFPSPAGRLTLGNDYEYRSGDDRFPNPAGRLTLGNDDESKNENDRFSGVPRWQTLGNDDFMKKGGHPELVSGSTAWVVSRGFTLIELLVVVLIIGILAAVAVPQYEKAVLKSRIQANMSLVKSLVEAEELYYLANGQYTPNMEDLDITLPSYTYIRGGSDWKEYRIGEDVKSKIALNAGSYNLDVYFSYPVPGNNGMTHTLELRLKFMNRSSNKALAGKWVCRDQKIAAMTKICNSMGFTVRESDYLLQF